ncbi:unnamed protein product [Caenorhabditis angaria]|uniref:Deoxyuridine 5'-triphosphate nucleotidohydrolase n=1 Tax=Caenorhabditis angaria TaxID=860376 RepID=A0A9P1IS14_9PELO|nr:unnamed protein product [Caenorhabditis angaria]
MSALIETTNTENIIAETAAKKLKLEEVPSSRLTVRFTKLNENAQMPTYGSLAAAGADLYRLQLELPFGYYGRVAPRSGLAAKHFIDVGAGVVDSDYRGELKVLLFNFNETDFEVKKGDRIAQLVCEQIAHCTYEQVESLDDTERGAGGFGSTGK